MPSTKRSRSSSPHLLSPVIATRDKRRRDELAERKFWRCVRSDAVSFHPNGIGYGLLTPATLFVLFHLATCLATLDLSGLLDDVKSSPYDSGAVWVERTSTRYERSERCYIIEWARIPTWIHPCAYVRYDGSEVRYMDANGAWHSSKGSKRGADDKSWTMGVGLSGKKYEMHRLVAIAYLKRPPVETNRSVVCHIVARPIGNFPNDSLTNLYWGTTTDNADDDARAGRVHIGKRRYFRGWREDSEPEEFETFATQQEAAEMLGVCQDRISKALANSSRRVGENLWRFEFIEMEFETGERRANIGGSTRLGQRFVTDRGRTGETKKITRDGEEVEIDVEFFLETDGNGYRAIGNVQGYERKAYLHRVIIETFADDEIEAKVKANPGMSWRAEEGKQQLEVDHIDGDKINNRLVNLRIVTVKEHRNKEMNVRAVVELDASRTEVIAEWASVTEASGSTQIPRRTLQGTCMRRTPLRSGRRFEFADEFRSGAKPEPKRKKNTRTAIEETRTVSLSVST